MNENKCPDHPERNNLYCLECVKEARAEQEKEDRIFYTQRVYVRDSLANILNEVRADTANQIFAELKKYDTGYGDIVLSKEDLQGLKKKYKVPR